MKRLKINSKFLFGFMAVALFADINISANATEVGKTANSDMAIAMDTSLHAAGSILACNMIGKGIKASFESTKNLNEVESNKAIMGVCATMYAFFIARAALFNSEESNK